MGYKCITCGSHDLNPRNLECQPCWAERNEMDTVKMCGNCRRAQRAFEGIYCDECTAHLKWKADRDAKAAELRTRHGKFTLSRYLLEDMQVCVVFGTVIVVRAEMPYQLDAIEYYAMSDAFEVVPEGNVTPEYVATIHTENGIPSKVTWKRV